MKKVLKYTLITLLFLGVYGASAQTYRVNVNTWLHIRQGPSIETAILGRVENNDRVYAIEIVGEWAKIKLTHSSYGYLNTRYLVLVPDTEREMSIDYKAEAKIREQEERKKQESSQRNAIPDREYDSYDSYSGYGKSSSFSSALFGDSDFSFFDLFFTSRSNHGKSGFSFASLFGDWNFSLFDIFGLSSSSKGYEEYGYEGSQDLGSDLLMYKINSVLDPDMFTTLFAYLLMMNINPGVTILLSFGCLF